MPRNGQCPNFVNWIICGGASHLWSLAHIHENAQYSKPSYWRSIIPQEMTDAIFSTPFIHITLTLLRKLFFPLIQEHDSRFFALYFLRFVDLFPKKMPKRMHSFPQETAPLPVYTVLSSVSAPLFRHLDRYWLVLTSN